MPTITKSSTAREANRRRVEKHREKRKQEATSSVPLSLPNFAKQPLVEIADQVKNKVASKVANKVSTAMVNELSNFIQPSSQRTLSDKPFERNYAHGIGCAILGAGAGYVAGSAVHSLGYAGLKKSDRELAKFRLYGLGLGAFLGGGLWYLNEEKQRAEVQTSALLADNSPVLQKPVTMEEMRTMRFEKVILNNEFHGFFGGNPNKHDIVLVHGEAGSAKSHFATKLLASLRKQGYTLYVSTEENESDRIYERHERYNADGVHYARAHSANDILSYVESYQPKFLVVDSLSNLRLSNDEERALMMALKSKIDFLVIILHATKDGTYRGSSSILHEADLEVILEKGIAKTGKNRLNGKGSMNLFPSTGNVFPLSQNNIPTSKQQ